MLLDRISVYRALKYFLQKGIVEQVPNNKGFARYILASPNNEKEKKRDHKNSYFICTCCQHTELIPESFKIQLTSLARHQVSKYSLIAEGICSNCKSISIPLILLFDLLF